MSKTLEPTALATAMSARPSLATAIELSASGMDVPAAKTVVPITTLGIFKMHPMRTHHSTIQCVMNPIHAMDMANESTYHFSHLGSPHGGIVSWNAAYQGSDNAHIGHSFLSSGTDQGDDDSSSSSGSSGNPDEAASLSSAMEPSSMARAIAAARSCVALSRAARSFAAFTASERYARMCPGVIVGVSTCASPSLPAESPGAPPS
mmetsp:Transcript_5204/g.20988  ORF Transcript_5204/g.20988 Transcript_5204/m.20988 type:complete len:205 (+) Transcript_5204:427-1041(+)